MLFSVLKLQNFKAFKGEHLFDFTKHGVGLHFLQGDNQRTPSLEANGAGKSTIWDALHWVLYGKSMLSIKAGNVRTWGTKGPCVVSLLYRERPTDSFHKTLVRSWSPNKLTMDGRVIEQEELDGIIGLNSDAFQHSVIAGQFNPMFFDLRAADKLAMFSGILNLDYWVEASKLAQVKSKSYMLYIEKLQYDIISVKSTITAYTTNLADNEIRAKNFEGERSKALTVFRRDRKALMFQRKETKSWWEATKKDLKKAIGERDRIIPMDVATLKIIDQCAATLDKLHDAVTETVHIIGDRTRAQYDFRVLGGECPKCGQDISDKLHVKVRKEAEKEIAGLDAKREKQMENYDLQKIELADYTRQQSERQEEYNKASAMVRHREDEEANAHRRIDLAVHDLDLIDRNRLSKEEEENPHTASIEQDKTRLEHENGVLSRRQSSLAMHNEEKAANDFWVDGFKKIRMELIATAIESLELEVNNCMVELGLEDWEVSFTMEHETKGGTIASGFDVFIRSPDNDERVPWHVWSGGEKQRLRLAGTMGLSNMILDARDVNFNIEVWDEPTQHIGVQGVDDLLGVLYDRANASGKQLWLVDHRSIDYGGFASRTCIIKDAEGARIESE